jgi:HPt (histidine-containing phosphotransfer) domain-containing protein
MGDQIVLQIDDPTVQALLPRYLVRRTQDVTSMREALGRRAFDDIALLAHRMRGSGAAYGMPFVTKTGRRLEHAAQAADAGVIQDTLDQLDAYLGRVRIA